MTSLFRRARLFAAIGAVAAGVAGCGTFGTTERVSVNTVGEPQQLRPLPESNVNSSSLPPLQASGNVAPGLSGTPVLGACRPTAP